MTGIERYRELRKSVEGRNSSHVQLHCKHLACKAGCDECCQNLSVFPVEFYAIVEDLRAAGVRELEFDSEAACGFLKDRLCTLYSARPMICRTHGMPIAFLNTELDEPAMNVSFCPKNFTDPESQDFGPENTIALDELNMELYEANVQFIEEHPELKLTSADRIQLGKLVEYLQ